MAKKQGTPSTTPRKQQESSDEGRFSISTIRRKLREYQRILTLTRRPTREEFSTIAKVAAIGIIVIGVAGFVIYLAMVQAPSYVTNATKTQQTTNASMQTNTVSPQISNTTGTATHAVTNVVQNSTTGITAT